MPFPMSLQTLHYQTVLFIRTYLPSIGANNHVNDKDDNSCRNIIMVMMRILLDSKNLKKSIEESRKTISSPSLLPINRHERSCSSQP